MLREDYGLQTLLDMHGYEFHYECGYWWRIEAFKVPPSVFRPHGIRYNLTLHNRQNHRIFGIDNAHGLPPPSRPGFTARRVVYDHIHHSVSDRGQPYYFHSAEQLMLDFFAATDTILKSAGVIT
ncbi:DUF6516 family protein [Shimwellia blattae]|uniref:Uncharacterized protein n=1 Tax=Shimwellia blattae (strain ATCC 29907 / DSM 4481 / JCM 1650 / NBRC 105725 / CDC 9005-74) TaxID=630626 RepID=I2BC47_SHIBC|nr:DUF6516 family protein [Shimwellia blattae]AFJ48101.1 hypothetical protein EBL_c30310 [Shimwellia blattae DSM 4481 = NBRC 105725]GAB81912.1 hypothetical protein EB105725_18_00400 [Shimwellia blattae DSM 4481 = NBRC 105725]VDY65599.1 Uncharacterised protein [Shimwellia blattae]VEC25058.1 Uncharacterised protein [Shimwellia blattae]